MRTATLVLITLLISFYSCKKGDKDKITPIPETQGIVVTVKDKHTGQPIPNANVRYVSTAKPEDGTTDGNGIFRKELSIGKYEVTVSAVGYKSDNVGKSVSIAVGQMTAITFELEQEPPLEIIPKNITIDAKIGSGSIILKNNSKLHATTVNIEISQNDQWLKITPTTLTLPAGSQKDLLVTVDGKGRGFGLYNSSVILNCSFNNIPFSETAYVNMNIPNPSAPSVTTVGINGITQTTVDVTGNLTNLGGSVVTQRGICWSEGPNPDPKTDPKNTISGGGLGTFTLTATTLKEGKTYWVRAFAENSNGIGFGEAVQVKTSTTPTPPTVILNPIASITQSSAILYGKVSNNGGSPLSEQGFVWSTEKNPVVGGLNIIKILANTDASGNISANMTGLTQGNVYYVRAYAINGLGTDKIGYSNELSFKTQLPTTPAVLTTSASKPSTITETSALLEGSVKELGTSVIKEHGFVWSRQNATPEFDNSDNVKMGPKNEAGKITHELKGLKKGTLYYFRAYAINAEGQSFYGTTQALVTKENGLVLYYPFNGDASDVSGNGNNAISTAKLTNDKFGNDQSAYDLSTGAIQVQNETIGRFRGDFTYSFRLKINTSAFKGSQKVLFSKGPANDICLNNRFWSGFMVYTEPSSASLNLFVFGSDSKQANIKISNANDISDAWHNITITKIGNQITIYINGEPFGNGNINTSTNGFCNCTTTNDPIYYEGRLTFSGFSYSGNCPNMPEKIIASIDDFRLYSYGLSDSEVEELSKR